MGGVAGPPDLGVAFASGSTMHGGEDALAALVSRSTLDKTGLAGVFDAELKWAPDRVAADAADGPSIFAALQQQLGLKLAAERGPVEVLVVDRVEEPSGN